MTKVLRVLLVTALVMCFAGCAATVSESSLQQLRARGVSSNTVHKFERGQLLSSRDIKELSRKGVDDTIILEHLRESGGIYRLTADEVSELRAAGVSDRVINYLLRTPELAEARRVHDLYFYHSSFYGYPYYYPYGPYYPHHGRFIHRRHKR
jgi:hypothetical protein